MPSLCSRLTQRTSLRWPGRAIGVRQELRHQEQRDARACPRGASGRARQHQVDDVLRQVVVAAGDEDLLPGDAVVIALASPPASQRAHVRARLRLGQVHRPGPFAGDQLRQVERLQLLAAVVLQRLDLRPASACGHSAKARLAALHISETAAESVSGRPCRHARAQGRPTQPPAANVP